MHSLGPAARPSTIHDPMPHALPAERRDDALRRIAHDMDELAEDLLGKSTDPRAIELLRQIGDLKIWIDLTESGLSSDFEQSMEKIRQREIDQTSQQIAVVLNNPEALTRMPKLRKNIPIMMGLIQQNPMILPHAGELRGNKEFVIAAINQYVDLWQYADPTLLRDKDVVMAMVCKKGLLLKYAERDFRKDRDIAMAAIDQNLDAWRDMDPTLLQDKDIVMAMVRKQGPLLKHVRGDLCKDKDIVMAAVSQNGAALSYADTAFRDNVDVVTAAVKQDGRALQFALSPLQENRDIVMKAMHQNVDALEYAGEGLRRDRHFMMGAMAQNSGALPFVHPDLCNDAEIVQAAINRCSTEGMQFPEKMRNSLGNNPDFLLGLKQSRFDQLSILSMVNPLLFSNYPFVKTLIGGDVSFVDHFGADSSICRTICETLMSQTCPINGDKTKRFYHEIFQDVAFEKEFFLGLIRNHAPFLQSLYPDSDLSEAEAWLGVCSFNACDRFQKVFDNKVHLIVNGDFS